MLSKPIPRWILLGGMALAMVAGGVNAVGILGVHAQPFSHLSGNVTTTAAELARAEVEGGCSTASSIAAATCSMS